MNIDTATLTAQYLRARSQWPVIDQMEQQYHLPRCLLYAVGSRETNLTDEVGDGGHGHSVWQLDDRSHTIPDPFPVAQAAEIAAGMLRGLIDGFPGNVVAALCAYNAGAQRVRTALSRGRDPNSVTTGGDYGADVVERMQFLATVVAPPAPTPGPIPLEVDVQIVNTAKTAWLSAAEAGIAGLPANAGYELHADGGIDAVNGAPFYGGYFNKPPSVRNTPRAFLALTPRSDGQPGYVEWANDGAFYAFGPDLWDPTTQQAA